MQYLYSDTIVGTYTYGHKMWNDKSICNAIFGKVLIIGIKILL